MAQGTCMLFALRAPLKAQQRCGTERMCWWPQRRCQQSVANFNEARLEIIAHSDTGSSHGDNNSSCDGCGGGSSSASAGEPWALMGRMVQEEAVAGRAVDEHVNRGLISTAAAREVGLEQEEFEANVERLLALMPFLRPKVSRLRPQLLAGLADDPERSARRLIELRALLPGADVAAVLGQRPSLLLDGEWDLVHGGLAGLARHYSEAEVASMVSVEPLLLLEDVDDVLRELQRLLPGRDAAAALAAQPALASQAMRLRALSLW